MTVETADTTAPETVEADETTETDDGQPERKMPREQRYRLERNQAREALTAAEARIEAYQRAEVLRLASDLAQPSDLLELGELGLAEYIGEDGHVDPDVVADTVAALIEARPGLARTPVVGAIDPTQGQSSRSKPAPAWSDLFTS